MQDFSPWQAKIIAQTHNRSFLASSVWSHVQCTRSTNPLFSLCYAIITLILKSTDYCTDASDRYPNFKRGGCLFSDPGHEVRRKTLKETNKKNGLQLWCKLCCWISMETDCCFDVRSVTATIVLHIATIARLRHACRKQLASPFVSRVI